MGCHWQVPMHALHLASWHLGWRFLLLGHTCLIAMVYYTPCQVRALDPKCPKCGNGKVVNIIYGYLELSENLKKDLDAGKTRLGGCCVSEDSHVWECNSCHHEWGKLEI